MKRCCSECDREIVIDDEPPNCYFTGRGPCGDCRDPRTNKPLDCFKATDWLCSECFEAETGEKGGWTLMEARC